MATDDSKRQPRTRRPKPLDAGQGTHATSYRGTREQLIEQVGVPVGLFENLESMRKRSIKCVLNGRQASVSRSTTTRFVVLVEHTPEERAAAEKRWEIERKIAQQCRQADQQRATWPKTATQYRENCLKQAHILLNVVKGICFGLGAGGFTLDEDGRDEVESALAAVGAIIKYSRIEFDPDFREANEKMLRVDIAKLDPAFGKLLKLVGVRNEDKAD